MGIYHIAYAVYGYPLKVGENSGSEDIDTWWKNRPPNLKKIPGASDECPIETQMCGDTMCGDEGDYFDIVCIKSMTTEAWKEDGFKKLKTLDVPTADSYYRQCLDDFIRYLGSETRAEEPDWYLGAYLG